MNINDLFSGDGLDRVKLLLDKHASLLREVNPLMSVLVAGNEEIFRRDPESRLKRVRSIHGNVNKPGLTKDEFFKRAAQLRDVAGVRLTIATKDQHPAAHALLAEAVKHLGRFSAKKDAPAKERRSDGYTAKHYYLSSKKYPGTWCEFQIRTLTEDLWAVFSHYEAYKRPTLLPISLDDLVNYSHLMDVADDYARTIRLRKIKDAEDKHRAAAAAFVKIGRGHDTPLDFATLEDVVNVRWQSLWQSLFPSEDKGGAIAARRLCYLLERLANYGIYTERQFWHLLTRTDLIQFIVKRMIAEGLQNRTRENVLMLLCECYKMKPAEVETNEQGQQLLDWINSHLHVLRLEEEADRMFEALPES